MTPFTDEDLKDLKETLSCDHEKLAGCFHKTFGSDDFQALIARLEAAEYALLRFKVIPKEDRTQETGHRSINLGEAL